MIMTINPRAGAVLEVVPTNPCKEFLLKGYVRQDMAWVQNFTDVNITIAAGAVQDCSGRDFSSAEVSAYIQNGSAQSSFIRSPGFMFLTTWLTSLLGQSALADSSPGTFTCITCILHTDWVQQASYQLLNAQSAIKKHFLLLTS